MKIERLQMSIQTVKENIAILESQEPEDAGYYLQLEHEKMVLNALEKQMPKHYDLWNNQCSCPTCNKLFGSYCQLKTLIHWEMPYCKFCGQALDWSDHPTEKGGEGE